jgi:ubiquinone/menaquinone biosynthesis C-methylase UbiE
MPGSAKPGQGSKSYDAVMQNDLEQLKQRMRGTWMAGDFGQIAKRAEKSGEEFVERLNLRPGMKVLDVACGTGNLAIPAARKGAVVSGVDIAPNLVDQARARAAEQGLSATFEEGDAEQLRWPDGEFDVVMSMFGAMFAPRPEMVAAELTRVCRPGGRVAMANWTPSGFVGRMFALGASYVPPPPGVPAPVLWGAEEVVLERFGDAVSGVETTRRIAQFDFPFGPAGVVAFFREYFGPTKMAFEQLGEEQRAAYAADLEKLWRESNEGDEERTMIQGEYLEVVATRR